MPRIQKDTEWGLWLGWSLLILFGLILIRVKMATVESETLVTMRDVIAWVIGIISAVLILAIWHFIQNRLSRYPSKLFSTHFHFSRPYNKKEIGKPLLLNVGQIYDIFFYAETKRVCEIERIGIRPQISKDWYKRWFRDYNKKTENLRTNSNNDLPIKILSATDVSFCSLQDNFRDEIDDCLGGRWVYYTQKVSVNPGTLFIYSIKIQTLKQWKGFIDFRWDSPNGMRVAHHRCEIREK